MTTERSAEKLLRRKVDNGSQINLFPQVKEMLHWYGLSPWAGLFWGSGLLTWRGFLDEGKVYINHGAAFHVFGDFGHFRDESSV